MVHIDCLSSSTIALVYILVYIFWEKIWIWFGRGLASANLIYFTINLFCFLIPRFLPRAFERYFKERAECNGKVAGVQPQTKEKAQKKSK